MKKLYLDYLFNHNVLVATDKSGGENQFEALFTLAKKYNIRITEGSQYASLDLLRYVGEQIPDKVTEAFYRGFPESVKRLTVEELLFDQLLHYYNTYFLDNFDGEADHSVFEADFEREAFNEKTEIKDYKIVDQWTAYELIMGYVRDLCLSSRPLSQGAYDLVKEGINDGISIDKIASRDTAIKLMFDLNKPELSKYINLSDTLSVVEYMVHQNYHLTGKDYRMSLKRLNLCNKDRRFISTMLDNMYVNEFQKALCFEKRADWKGLLHHIHYKPKKQKMKEFVAEIRNYSGNKSVMSTFESYMSKGDVISAVNKLVESKGSSAVLRNLNYMLSRCKNRNEVSEVVSKINSDNPILLIQLIAQYKNYVDDSSSRTFTFTKNYKLKTHRETSKEQANRKSHVSKMTRDMLVEALYENLRSIYKNKLGKVYISEEMKNLAVPLQETTAEIGMGILPKGTRIHIPDNKKIRAFTYWSKVDDIDLSAIGICRDGSRQIEFSWRNFYFKQGDGMYFSGDQTRGFNGGSEFLDMDINKFKKAYPQIKYLVFCDNVFSGTPFSECDCKAGYMLRDINDTGNVWEPKALESAYKISGNSTFSYMFAIDMDRNDFVWLNMCKDSMARVAGETDVTFLTKYMNMADVLSTYDLFEMMATEVTDNMKDADVIVSDEEIPTFTQTIQNTGETIEIEKIVVTSRDTEKILKYLNNN